VDIELASEQPSAWYKNVGPWRLHAHQSKLSCTSGNTDCVFFSLERLKTGVMSRTPCDAGQWHVTVQHVAAAMSHPTAMPRACASCATHRVKSTCSHHAPLGKLGHHHVPWVLEQCDAHRCYKVGTMQPAHSPHLGQ
jgi:hypothetical protein